MDDTISLIEECMRECRFDEATRLADIALRKHKVPARLILLGAALHDAVGNRQRRTALLKRGRRLHPEDWTIALAYASYAGSERDWETTAELYHAAWTLLPADERWLRAECCMQTGLASIETGDTANAVAAWKQAMHEDPTFPGASGLLLEYTNVYGEPRCVSPVMDDVKHFQNIHIERYMELAGGPFLSMEEANAFITRVMDAWNDHVAPRYDSMKTLSASEKTTLFAGVPVDYSLSRPQSAAPQAASQLSGKRGRRRPHADIHHDQPDRLKQQSENVLRLLVEAGGFPDLLTGRKTRNSGEQDVLRWAAEVATELLTGRVSEAMIHLESRVPRADVPELTARLLDALS